jgi:hypothetical protein
MPMAKVKQKSPFVGLWHIVSMETWDEDYFNEEVQAFIEFEESGAGHFRLATSRATWTGDPPHGTGNRAWSGPGRVATARTARR